MGTFTVSPRATQGEKPKHLRQKGLVPMVLVDRAHQSHPIKASVAALQAAVRGADEHGVIQLQIEGEAAPRKALLKSLDGDALARQVLSATFQEVSDEDRVKADIPVVAQGHNDDAGDQTVLTAVTSVLHVRGRVTDLPHHIEVDVSKLGVGEHISASDVALPEGIELLSSPDVVLFSVSRVQAPVLEDTDTEAAGPEGTQAEAEGGSAVSNG